VVPGDLPTRLRIGHAHALPSPNARLQFGRHLQDRRVEDVYYIKRLLDLDLPGTRRKHLEPYHRRVADLV
jgi:hypothetical protein